MCRPAYCVALPPLPASVTLPGSPDPPVWRCVSARFDRGMWTVERPDCASEVQGAVRLEGILSRIRERVNYYFQVCLNFRGEGIYREEIARYGITLSGGSVPWIEHASRG